jgi:glycine/D-amino acid oxidase-like deaminating enzyme
MQQGMEFLEAAQKFSAERVHDPSIKLYRFLFSDADLKYWSDASRALPNLVSMQPLDAFQATTTGMEGSDIMTLQGVARITQGTIVNSRAYLQALWKATVATTPASEWMAQRLGPEDVARLSAEYDEVVLACGAGIPRLCGVDWPKYNKLSSLRLIRGHNLLFRQEGGGQEATTDRAAYLSGEYIIPAGDASSSAAGVSAGSSSYLLCGPTHDHVSVEDYERLYAAEGEQRSALQAAEGQLLDRLRRRYPSMAGRRPFVAIAGTRLVTQRGELGRLPIVGRLPGSSNVWIHGGFGSRGLILHALTANYLRDAIAAGDEARIPVHLGVLTTKLTDAEKPR